MKPSERIKTLPTMMKMVATVDSTIIPNMEFINQLHHINPCFSPMIFIVFKIITGFYCAVDEAVHSYVHIKF